MNRLVRRQRAALALFIALTVSGVGVAMATPQAGDQPTVTLNLSPSDGQGLTSPSSLNVTGAGFPASTSGILVQSADLPNGTTIISGTIGTFTSNGSGGFVSTVNVSQTFVPDAGGTPIDCNAVGVTCYVEAFTTSGNANSRHSISFAGGTTVPPTTVPPTTVPPTTVPPTTVPPTTVPPTTVPPTTVPPTTVPPTTAPPTTVPPTTAPPTTIGGPTTTLGAAQCAQIRAARAQLNAQIDAARQQVLNAGLSPQQQAASLAQLEDVRARGNAQLDALLAGCPAP